MPDTYYPGMVYADNVIGKYVNVDRLGRVGAESMVIHACMLSFKTALSIE